MNPALAACALAGLLAGVGACGTNTPSPVHAKTHAVSGGVVTTMTNAQSMDLSRSCTHAPGQAECAAQWTVEYRDTAGAHSLAVTEAAFNDCLRGFPGVRYPDCANGGQ